MQLQGMSHHRGSEFQRVLASGWDLVSCRGCCSLFEAAVPSFRARASLSHYLAITCTLIYLIYFLLINPLYLNQNTFFLKDSLNTWDMAI